MLLHVEMITDLWIYYHGSTVVERKFSFLCLLGGSSNLFYMFLLPVERNTLMIP